MLIYTSMVDGRSLTLRISQTNQVENSKSGNKKIVGQRYNTFDILRGCCIKLRRIKFFLNVNNCRCMNATATEKRVVLVSKVPLVQHSTAECEETVPFMFVTQQNRERKERLNKPDTPANNQMLEDLARFPHVQETRKGCKNLVVKVKRLRLEKQHNKLKSYNNGDTLKGCKNLVVKVKRLRLEKQHNKLKSYNNGDTHNSQDSVAYEIGNTVALQDQCALNLFETSEKSKLQVPITIKNAVVKLKRIKPQSPIRTLKVNASPLDIENPECNNGAVYQDFCHHQKNSNLQVRASIKKAVVKLKRFKPKSTPGPFAINNPTKDNEQLNFFQTQKSEPVKGSNVSKMKTRFGGRNRPTLVPKPKPSLPASPKNNVFLKQNELITDLFITPERRNSMKKLSLTMSSRNRKIVDGDGTSMLDLSHFSPVRNSTVFGVAGGTCDKGAHEGEIINLNKKREDINEKSKENSNSKEDGNRKSLTNKPELIEQLLLSDTDEDEKTQNHSKKKKIATSNQTQQSKNKTQKFFHRTPKKKLSSRKAPDEHKSIFEFLSQSDNSGSENGKHRDPAADVIQKLISEGKVRVAVNQKGKGRPIIKRARPKTERKKQLTNKVKTSKAIGKQKHTKTSANMPNINEGHNNNNQGETSFTPVPEFFEDDHHDATAYFNDEAEADEPISEGGFSRLARSVLLQQTKKYENTRRNDIAEQRRLLEAARKFVSTPASNRKSENLHTADLSPIQTLDTRRRPVCPSPWRIDDESHLPRTFNFTKNTSYLPTFSSDYIPSTPKKNKLSTNSHVCNESNVQCDTFTTTEQENLPTVPRNISDSDSGNMLQDSLGSRNDSNEENIPPPESLPTRIASNNDENDEIVNMRQLPNPRRTLDYRSPLKTINIIEVVTLAPWKKPVNNDMQEEQYVTPINCDSKNSAESHKADDLFGFEEYLDCSSDDGKPSNTNNITVTKGQWTQRDLHKKLKELKKWRPKDSTRGKTNVTIKQGRLFDDNEGRPKQQLINDMLCSTMIDQKNKNLKEQEENIEKNPPCSWEEENVQAVENDFFNDYEPAATFEKKPQRTYARPVRKKRKCRKSFVMFSDSEDSNSDSDEEKREYKKGAQKKRRHETHANAKQNTDLESFVHDFNSMCKEVESYELHVE
ncbi:protein dalmatian isoform X5 [Rhagoletis pomonella]|uniref:protein dalmatian isoform X5 n=1 Tax=Rhagoletis pomonella TaxID=28610 RepID=UPI00178240E1|nr:protein dalmatian isoform X5 [Rhagoletis pomonella]